MVRGRSNKAPWYRGTERFWKRREGGREGGGGGWTDSTKRDGKKTERREERGEKKEQLETNPTKRTVLHVALTLSLLLLLCLSSLPFTFSLSSLSLLSLFSLSSLSHFVSSWVQRICSRASIHASLSANLATIEGSPPTHFMRPASFGASCWRSIAICTGKTRGDTWGGRGEEAGEIGWACVERERERGVTF